MVYRKAWEVAYQRDRAAGRPRYVDVEPTRVRLARLTDAGAPRRAVARATGLSDTAVQAILRGDRRQVQRATAERVAKVSLQQLYSRQPTGHVPRVGAVRRVQALMALGWSHQDLAAAGAANTPGLLNRPGHLVTVARWREIREVYDRLSMTPGPSSVTRSRAASCGYVPPLAWGEEDIDDPTAKAQGTPDRQGTKRPATDIDPVVVARAVLGPACPQLTPAERTQVLTAMFAAGASDGEIGTRLGVTGARVWQLRHLHGITHTPPRAGTEMAALWAAATAISRQKTSVPTDVKGLQSAGVPSQAVARSVAR